MTVESRGWCVEHSAHETERRGLCPQSGWIEFDDDWSEVDCRIEKLMTRKEHESALSEDTRRRGSTSNETLYVWAGTDSTALEMSGTNRLRLLTELVMHGVLIQVWPEETVDEE